MSGEDLQLSEEQGLLDRTVEAFEQALAELRSRHSTGGIDEFANDALERMRGERGRFYTQASCPLYFGRIDRTDVGPTDIGRMRSSTAEIACWRLIGGRLRQSRSTPRPRAIPGG